MFNYAESVKSVVRTGSGMQLLDEETANFFKAAIDEARTKIAETPIQGSKYFAVKNVDKNNYSSQDMLGIGLAEVNSDAEDLPVDGNGDLAPQMLEKVIVSPELEDTMKEISGSSLKVDTSLNTTNIVAGTPYEVWHWLNANTIIYCGDEENGVEFHIRQNPGVLTWEDGSNPDKIWSRMRMAIGTGAKRPGKFIGQLTA
jgi:hypothetical protein